MIKFVRCLYTPTEIIIRRETIMKPTTYSKMETFDSVSAYTGKWKSNLLDKIEN
jgi:hypothetical protein